ncbi:metal-dependent transcriptional regulator [Halorhabdus sp. CBA1104]|uniref:metal-dependent transcriptional regulator n=1 Tax=Halorhabdus sp. CBA1104 TaxID=1380432 RepID=UPI0012B35FA6|nr:metal-dependent transcriptional regulator [Halorhabdus sp. CBA1104]QGN06731.1 metal-dependent transcriptional regulator [Halorhabdus sp. CBA1104]
MSLSTHAVVDDLTPGEGRYLCGVLYRTLVDTSPVSNRELTDYLDVSGASVTGMVESLAEEGLVKYERYRGVELTDRGERVARAVLWRRCATQQFFENELAFSLANDQAYRIAIEFDRNQVRAVGDHVDQPCEYHCEATDASDCDVL